MTESEFSWEPPERQKLLLQKEETIYFRSNKEWFLKVWQDRNSTVELGYKLYHIIFVVHNQESIDEITILTFWAWNINIEF